VVGLLQAVARVIACPKGFRSSIKVYRLSL
jgi:hypothetical protein